MNFFVISTPIGNLKDITYRAVEVLKSCDVIFCENPNHHRKLLSHLGIKGKRLLKINASNETSSINGIIKILNDGKIACYVSDAGTPSISDPGGFIVRELQKNGIRVTPIPGVSSLTAAVSISIIPCDRFIFLGFPPKSSQKLKSILDKYNIGLPLVFFISKHNIKNLLEVLKANYPSSSICICKELTKLNENVISGTVKEINLSKELMTGEFVVILSLS